jgi:long-chain acyl-CoA synthetase
LGEGYKTHALWDALIFAKIRQVLGGRVRLILSGSAPLSADVKEFMKIVFCCDVVEGYGLSETAAGLCLASGDMPLGPHVGPPIVRMQVCLEDVPEMGYTSRDKPRPRGEILAKGPVVFAGYYKQPEKTAEVFDENGWFHTGDIGCWNADGTLSIIDRKKNIFKLSQGEYVAAEKIEGVYLKSKYVAQVFVYGDSLQSCLVAVVVPDPEMAEAWGHAKGLAGEHASVPQLVHNAAFQKEVLEDMDATARLAKLRGFELVKKVHFHPDAFSVDEGLITPTFKLKRPQLKTRFQAEIKHMYVELQ